MKKHLLLLLLAGTGLTSFGQDTEPVKEPSAASRSYHQYRLEDSEPTHALNKIRRLIASIKLVEDDEGGGTAALPPGVYNSLTLHEKFTYHVMHPESYSQICDVMPEMEEEDKKIFAQLPDAMNEFAWADRQLKFFTDNRDSVLLWIREEILQKKRVGLNYKKLLLKLNAVSLIPDLIFIYDAGGKKDFDLLTLAMLLMLDNKYPVFLKSAPHKDLYGESANYLSHIYYNPANEALILKLATRFYRETVAS